MPTWGQILNEINTNLQKGDQRAFDNVRQHYIQQLANFTGRDVIVYASRWTSGDAPPNLVSIIDEDIQGFMEAIHGLKKIDSTYYFTPEVVLQKQPMP